VAGLLAADHLYELGLAPEDVYSRGVALEGHPDNVAAALYGGFVLCPPSGGDGLPRPVRLEPPQGVEAVLVVPEGEVSTASARDALPREVPLSDAVANVAAASQLVLGIQRSDLALISNGLADRLHQPARARLYPRSLELVTSARQLGALGATISGAGPAVLVWSYWQDTGKVMAAVEERAGGWADVRRVPFNPLGADVAEL
jgi:homoserine kinase